MPIDEHASREYQGWWWRASSPERRCAGTLKTTPGDYGTLEVVGLLFGSQELTLGNDAILGEVPTAGRVTIASAHVTLAREFGTNSESQVITCHSLFVGRHLPEGYATGFSGATLETYNTPVWLSLPMPNVDRDDQGGMAMSLPAPADRTASIPGLGSITLSVGASAHYGRGDGSLRLIPRWILRADDDLNAEEVWSRFILPIAQFLTLATGESDGPRSLALHLPDDEYGEVQWLSGNRLGRADGRDYKHRHHSLLQVEEAGLDWESLLQRWFSLQEKAKAPLLEFFSVTWGAEDLYAEEIFLRTVRAVEVWHRSTTDGVAVEKVEYDGLVDRMLDGLKGIEPDRRQFFKDRLSHGYEYSLAERLRQILAEAGPSGSSRANALPRFVRRVVDTRNNMTHRSDMGDAFTMVDAMRAQRALTTLMHNSLLVSLGFSMTQREMMLTRANGA